MSKATTAFTIAVILAFVALPTRLSGQHESHAQSSDTASGMMDRMMERMQEMHGSGGSGGTGGGMSGGMSGAEAVGPGPAAILGMVEELDLSADQIAHLGQIRERLTTVRKEETVAAESAAEAATLALQGHAPDFEAYEEALRRQADHHVRIQVATARAAVEARHVLTASQVEQLEASMGGGMSHSSGGGGGGSGGGGGGGGHSH